ncbi:hypothetical protein [Coprobacter sp.]
MEQIFRTLQELEELLKLIDKSSPDVPDILYKLAVEKAEAVTVGVKGLPFVNSGIPEDKVFSGDDCEDVIDDICTDGGKECISVEKPEASATRSEEENFQEKVPESSEILLMAEQNSLDFVVKDGIEESCLKPGSPSAVDKEKELKDIRRLMSLNDKFRFKRELFVNSDEVMNNTLEALNEIFSFEESVAFLQDQFGWDIENNEPAAEFFEVVEKRFTN